jgi:hypothetical protein
MNLHSPQHRVGHSNVVVLPLLSGERNNELEFLQGKSVSFIDSAATVFGMTELHTHKPNTTVTFREVRRQIYFAEVELSVHLVNNGAHVNIHRSPVETQTPKHCDLLSSSMTTTSPVLSPSSILLSPSSHCAFIPARKNSALVQKFYHFSFFTLLKLCKLGNVY